MLSTVLVPIGDIMRSERAVQHATLITKAFSARAHLLGIVQYNSGDDLYPFQDPILWNAAKNKKQADLTELASKFEAQHIAVETGLLDVCTSERFLSYVQDYGFNLIVVSDEDSIPYTLMRNVLAHTFVPIYIARAPAADCCQRILIPLDGSQRAEYLLPLITTLAQAMRSTLLLTHIVKEPEMPRLISSNVEDVQLAEQFVERNRQEMTRYLTELSKRLPVPTEIHVVTHHSVTTALHELIKQQNVDLVGLSAHGHSGQPDQPFGSITNNLIDYGLTSLIVFQDMPSTLPAIEREAVNRNSHIGGGQMMLHRFRT